MSLPVLYDYFRSSAAFRVRIALGIKGIAYESREVHLLRDGGEQHSAAYRSIQPSALVPAFDDGTGPLAQSIAIVEYLEETRPEPPLLPKLPRDRAFVRSVALSVACDIHPLCNLRVLGELTRSFGADETAREAWIHHWIALGLGTVEAMLTRHPRSHPFAHGDAPTLADLCIVPQVKNAERFGARLDHVPEVVALYRHCMTLPAFAQAAPEARASSGTAVG
jgi:maleylpyruvate isomerase